MKARDRKALDPVLYFIRSYTRCTRIHLPSFHLLPFIGISQRRLSASACLPPFLASPTHPLPPPSPSKKCPSIFNQAIRSVSIVRLFFPHIFPSSFLTSPPSRSFDPERKTFHKRYKSQCRSCIIQNKDHCSQGPFFPRSNSTGLTCLSSCTAYGPTPARSTQDRQLTFKVQYVF
jgi:hypothetical protein